MRRRLAAGTVVSLGLCLAGCAQQRGQVAPRILVDEWLNTEEGLPLNLEAARGQPAIIEFWATW